jgi:uncharacterized membrane protein YfcA
MEIYLPLAEMSMNAPLLLAVGAIGGFLSGMFGVGGAFVVTPLLISIGVPPVIAVGTQAAQLAGTALSGAIEKNRKGDIDVRLGLVLAVGSLGGVSFGAILFQRLRHAGQIDLAINLGYAIMLSVIGILMLRETLLAMSSITSRADTAIKKPWGAEWIFSMTFPASRVRMSVLSPLAVGFGCGILTVIFGVGSGFILVPAMLYLLRMPASVIAGTSMFQIVFTSAYATIIQSIMNHNVDLILALVLLTGSLLGVKAGARTAARLSAEKARFILAAIILIGAVKLWSGLLIMPHELFTLSLGSGS